MLTDCIFAHMIVNGMFTMSAARKKIIGVHCENGARPSPPLQYVPRVAPAAPIVARKSYEPRTNQALAAPEPNQGGVLV